MGVRSAAAKEGETHIGALVDEIAGEQKLSDDDLSALVPSGSQSLLMNRLHWAKTYMQRAGLLESKARLFSGDRTRPKLLNEGLKRIDNGSARKVS